MPELPEVEVTRLGVEPHLLGQRITGLVLRRSGLRWPFPENLAQLLVGQQVIGTARRAKYLLILFSHGTLIIHLGMSGHIRVLPLATPAQRHDHVDIELGTHLLRLTDPRRFGAVLWHCNKNGPIEQNDLFRRLGVEPLTAQFNGAVLYRRSRGQQRAVKQMLLSGDIVVGVGNIYASESLFLAGINPMKSAGSLGLVRYKKLATVIQSVLVAAIAKGGSTLRDFIGVDGQKGYFQQTYFVYDRANFPCLVCGTLIRQVKQGQRSTFYCVKCQK